MYEEEGASTERLKYEREWETLGRAWHGSSRKGRVRRAR